MILSSFRDLKPTAFETKWRSPANIAFVKYWGKKGHQLPANPSVSLTLKECTTDTKVEFSQAETLGVELYFEGAKKDAFGDKIKSYLETLSTDLPWMKNIHCKIETSNTFPHGAGIASSASGLSAFALCLTDYLHSMRSVADPALFQKHASFLARLASGSACRSVYGGFVTWGESELSESSDLHAEPLAVHIELANLCDSVIVVSDKEKKVSSREGHSRLKDHFFAQARYVQAKHNFTQTIAALKVGDMERVGEILENEAFSLHAMMMTSPQSFTLLRPNSLNAIEIVRAFREETKIPVYFTLDAGPNLHLIYPPSFKNKVETFINVELANFASSVIHDQRGDGPMKC